MARNVGQWISHWSKVTPNKKAIIFHEKTYTYQEFNNLVNQYANTLRSLGIEREQQVACLSMNTPEYLFLFFACAKLGIRFVPINVRSVAQELKFFIDSSEAKVLFAQKAFQNVVERAELNGVKTYYFDKTVEEMDSMERVLSSDNREVDDRTVTWETDLAICFTSGTTGNPKGAVLTHSNIFWVTTQMIIGYSYTAEDVWLVAIPLCFTGGLVPASMPCFHSGGTMVLEKEIIPNRMLKIIEKYKVSAALIVTSICQFLTQDEYFEQADLRSFKALTIGAAPIPSIIVEKFKEKNVRISNGYGITEGAACEALLPVEDMETRNGAYLPCLYTEMIILDDSGNEVAVGEIGEVGLRGPVCFKEYWKNPEATASSHINGWFKTGDLGYKDEDGYFHLVDRKKDMIITGSLNVYSTEVESALLRNDAIKECAVIGVHHDKWGEAVTAVIVQKIPGVLTESQVMDYCREILSDYKCPKKVIFTDQLPYNTSGKLLKRKLRDQFINAFSV
jgi:fatty-acyl-CoA synthase